MRTTLFIFWGFGRILYKNLVSYHIANNGRCGSRNISVMCDAAAFHIQFVVDIGTYWRISSVLQFKTISLPKPGDTITKHNMMKTQEI